jgi:hypothetical protein
MIYSKSEAIHETLKSIPISVVTKTELHSIDIGVHLNHVIHVFSIL